MYKSWICTTAATQIFHIIENSLRYHEQGNGLDMLNFLDLNSFLDLIIVTCCVQASFSPDYDLPLQLQHGPFKLHELITPRELAEVFRNLSFSATILVLCIGS